MSARALRKLQRELEEKKQLEQLAAENEDDESEDELPAVRPAKASMFAMLGAGEDDDDDDDDDGQDEGDKQEPEEPAESRDDSEEEAPKPKASSAKRKKKKKKGKAAKQATDTPTKDQSGTSELDEIDLALQSLRVGKVEDQAKSADESAADIAAQELYKLLAVETQSLHAQNEMRKLFGRAALENRMDNEPAGGRRRGRGAQQLGLAQAVAARNMPGGQGLASLGLRRNIFIQGKEEWPRATSGGLGMEIVEKRTDGTVEYRFIHSTTYQDVQRQFESCVASMDPNRLVQLLQFNPYHISTLLQVSEIAKQERDHATSGDLLERALFSFGRSVHSTFSNNLSQGKARLDFRRPENREFWLAAWRYIANLGMRSTWRTVYEWAKLLLSLDPENDPYCVRLILDQFAVRGRQQRDFLDLSQNAFFKSKWADLPNVQLSSGLLHVQANERGKGQQKLYTAIGKYPWVAARLFQELEINDIPPGIWGKQPRTPYEHLLTELYVIRAKDIWNTPEAKNLLVEVASAVQASRMEDPAEASITRDMARHTILTDNPALIGAVPRSLTSQVQSTSDPLPPSNNLASYDPSPSITSRRHEGQTAAEMREEYSNLRAFFQSLMPWFQAREQDAAGEQRAVDQLDETPPLEPDVRDEEVVRRMMERGIPFQEFWERTQRFEQLQNQMEMMGELEEAVADLPGAGQARAGQHPAGGHAEGGGGGDDRTDGGRDADPAA
ncbi:transcriptional repressor TCF25-domain-containing protein [Macrophomina phaseolina]|uniref:Transcriptional repressor TCF25-domain-containing protein n=1 Tax=Macrophomina phaseolina TaxID=35725 RepID=A0ABQ8FW51_9PEZI|nr:transcriptional repressor TCF25-domain-containing protein [Macrophomina phaseolina]